MLLENTVVILDRLSKWRHLLFRLLRPAKVYYLDVSENLNISHRDSLFVELNTGLCPKIFADSLQSSFDYANSQAMKNSQDYRICERVLKSVLDSVPDDESQIAVKRFFHRTVYNDTRKQSLIDYVADKHKGRKIAMYGFAGQPIFYYRPSSQLARPLRLIEQSIVGLQRFFAKAFSFFYFLKMLRPFKIRRKVQAVKLDTLIIAYQRHKLLCDIYKKIGQQSGSAAFFLMDHYAASDSKQDRGLQGRCVRNSDMVLSWSLLCKAMRIFCRFWTAALQMKDTRIYKETLVFIARYFVWLRAMQNISAARIVSNEDYQEFNPRYFAARVNNCELVNILVCKIVPTLNPYISFALIDTEITYTKDNCNILRNSDGKINRFIQLENFRGFLPYMQSNYRDDFLKIAEAVKSISGAADKPLIITYYSTGSEANFSYIDIPIAIKTSVLQNLKHYLACNKDALLLIKPHPDEIVGKSPDGDYYEIMQLPNVIIVDKSISSYSLLQFSDVNISDISSMGPHSKLFNFNTIIANLLDIALLFESDDKENTLTYCYATTDSEFFAAMVKMTARRISQSGRNYNDPSNIFIEELCNCIAGAPSHSLSDRKLIAVM